MNCLPAHMGSVTKASENYVTLTKIRDFYLFFVSNYVEPTYFQHHSDFKNQFFLIKMPK